MAFKDFPEQEQAVQLLQRSLERGRLAHAYLFTGHQLDELEAMARTLAKTLNCQKPARGKAGGAAVDCCDTCLACRKIANSNHADVHWVRPESKSRVIVIEQMRDLMQEINLKPTEAEYKVAVIVAADRLNVQAANAFLKTLEEPPAKSDLDSALDGAAAAFGDDSVAVPAVEFRRRRLAPIGRGANGVAGRFSEMAASEQKSLLGRYRLHGCVAQKLGAMKAQVEEALTAQSPLQRYDDVEKSCATGGRTSWRRRSRRSIVGSGRICW